MSVHYKFKSALDFDTITFDGLHISVADLKKAIIQQKRLGKSSDFDLQITNAQTKEEYPDDGTLIPKNTSLIIARIPLAAQPKKPWDPQSDKNQGGSGGSSSGMSNICGANQRSGNSNESNSGTLDLSQMNGTEEDKIQAMMIQSTMDYDPNNYQKIRGQGQTGEVPPNYRCFKCHKPGHWIKNCPLSTNTEHIEIKRNTGIPRSFIERDAQEKSAEQSPEPPPPAEKKQEIPEDLICSICKDLLTDAVMIPCCGSSFCDECVRTALLESEENECPDCKEKGSSPGLLIPNRFLRNSVNAFKNETGYNKPPHKQEPPKPTTPIEDSTVNQSQQKVASVSQEQHSSEEKSFREETTSSPVTETEANQEKDEESNEIPLSTTPPQPPPSRDKNEHEEYSSNTEVKKQNDVTAHSSHDENESDFEDNITVTVPPAHLQSQRAAFRERHYNGRHSRHIKPPGLDNSPKGNSNSQNSPSQEMRTNSPTTDDSEQMTSVLPDQQKPHSMPHHGMSMVRPIRPTGPDMYGGLPMMNSYGHPPQPQPIIIPGRPPYDMGHYGMPPGPGYVTYIRGPFPPMRPGYHPPHLIRPRHMAPMGNFASVYQGVAAKVGSGIIDDPLEAFNRIMREKEKRKGERRRTPERRRSRSIEMNTARGRHSPPPSSYHGRQSRVRTSEERVRGRSPLPRERRGRSRDKRSMDKDRRRHHSSSFSDRSSRSRSWSFPSRKRSKSPTFRRRSRSRSQTFSTSRSRSRSRSHSNSQGRFRGQPPPMRYNRSPMNTMSPRYRHKENRRPERRDDFQREEFRDRSPIPGGSGIGHYMSRRPRSRGRIMSPQNPQYFRQDNRPPFNHGQDDYYNHPPQQGPPPQMSQPTNMGMYNENYQQYNRYPPRDMNIPPNRPDTYGGRDRVNTEYKDRYDDAPPPGTEEPPPPGFENSPPPPPPLPQTRERRNSRGNDYRKQHDDSQKEYDDARHTPELKDKQPSTEKEVRRRYRSWSKSHSPVNPSRSAEKVSSRRSRSKTPRTEKNQENYVTKERSSNKERHTSSREGQGHISDKEKPEHDKRRDRGGEDRDRKHGEHSKDKDKKDIEKKVSEKESKYTTKDDKEKEKEKEKKRESSDDEKKDRRSREKKKKKKEKDEKKRIKKEKKEKEKKEKEKEREKVKESEKEKDSMPLEGEDKEKLKSEEMVSEEKQVDDKTTVQDNSISEIKNENELLNDSVVIGVDTKLNASQDREEEIKLEHEENEVEKKDSEDKFELYEDICQEEEIRYDYVSSQNEENKTEVTDKSSPTEMKGLDSVLDIHANLDFEPDLEEMTNNEENKKDNVMVPLPEPSKWERDDENQSTKDEKLNVEESVKGIQEDDKSSKVTNEVIRRAENAIFARAINAIRPIEIKKISVERQKLYANEPVSDLSPSATSSIKTTQNSPKSELQSFQITVPVNRTNSSERSVEIKQEKPTKRPSTPVRSVKDRLGSKITEPIPQKRMRSRSNSPVRNSVRDKGKPARSRSREFRDTKRGMDNKRSYENRGRSRDRERIHKDFKPIDYRNRDNNRDRLRMNDRNRKNFMNRDRQNKFRERERSRDHDRDRRKSLDKSNKGYDRDRSNEHNRDRDHTARDTNYRDHHKKWDREKNDNYDNKKDRSRSKSSDRESRKDRYHKKERNIKKWYSEDEKTKSSERMASENKGKDIKQIFINKEERQKSEIKEDNEEHNKQIPDKVTINNENLFKKSDKISKQTKNQTSLTKRSRSKSESSSSSSSSDYDSDSESEDNKKKKKKKHKKDKKRARRSSSVDSSPSTKHKRSKRSKSKKKKSSKKKKKSKK